MRPVVRKSVWFVVIYLGGLVAVGAVALVIRAFLKV
jgi:hypothetical protein